MKVKTLVQKKSIEAIRQKTYVQQPNSKVTHRKSSRQSDESTGESDNSIHHIKILIKIEEKKTRKPFFQQLKTSKPFKNLKIGEKIFQHFIEVGLKSPVSRIVSQM